MCTFFNDRMAGWRFLRKTPEEPGSHPVVYPVHTLWYTRFSSILCYSRLFLFLLYSLLFPVISCYTHPGIPTLLPWYASHPPTLGIPASHLGWLTALVNGAAVPDAR